MRFVCNCISLSANRTTAQVVLVQINAKTGKTIRSITRHLKKIDGQWWGYSPTEPRYYRRKETDVPVEFPSQVVHKPDFRLVV